MRTIILGLFLAFTTPALASGPICFDDSECVGLEGTTCIDNHCESSVEPPAPECIFDRDCPSWSKCVSRRCARPGDSCTFDNECPRRHRCHNRRCLR